MRPLELRLRNFRSFFGDGHTFDFRDRHLVGIVGPIGAGKSTILDAIVFALYGRTPRINRSTKSLIHQRADHAAVALRFEVDGQIWEAVRQLRARGQSQHALYLYEEDTPDPDAALEKIMLEGEVNERIEALLGLDYDAFGRSILLAQGQFDEFLNSPPAGRDKVLKGVFGHERIDAMRELAKVRAKDTNHEVEKLGIRLEQVEAAAGRLARRREALAALARRIRSLEAVQPDFQKLTESMETTLTRVEAGMARFTELSQMAEKLPDADRSEEVLATAERARQRRSALAIDLEAAHEKVAEADASVKSSEFVERSARLKEASELIVRLEGRRDAANVANSQLVDAGTRLETSQAGLEAKAEVVGKAEGELSSVAVIAATSSERLAHAESSLMDARHADMATALRHQLTAGHACPVCEQPVHKVPSASSEIDMASAEVTVELARGERDRAEGALRSATASLEAERMALTSADTRLEESRKDQRMAEEVATEANDVVSASLREIVLLLGEGDPMDRLEAERVAIDQLGGLVETARKVVEEVRRLLDDAISTEQEADRTLGDLRTQLVALATHLDAAGTLPDDSPAALRTALVSLRDGWGANIAELQHAIETDEASVVVIKGRLAEIREALQIEGSLSDALAAVRAEANVAESEIAKDEAVVTSAADVVAERDRLEIIGESYRRLASDLSDAKFIRFLLDEERRTLGELGSNHFQRLSSGRYRFSDDGTFRVVDLTAADALRKADSLSGGETFLASLGLALGLSEMVGRTGGRLDAFFLDEGFGSLDSEHLDLAMEGIEALVTEQMRRLVVVVSHVPELRHRIEDLIVLDKDPVTGDSIVMSGAVADD